MAYEVLARKWRPKNFSELIGQSSACQTLSNALKQNRLYPVLLFTGPRGTGKTSSARILAKSLRCPHQKDQVPCDQCEDCLLIQASRHLDVIEIDGASNNGVDAVRELRDTVAYLPSTGSWKVYIIDEAHMLSNSAFNALLKTFEEPPAHVLFIMATTESRKIPQTVLSRAQRLDFHLISPVLIKKQLEIICEKEKFPVPEDVLWIVAKQARGSLRDGQSLLDQVITFCGENLNREKVINLLGLSDPHVLFQCLQALIHRKENQMITVIEQLRAKGNEPQLFLQNLIEALANLLFLKKNPENRPELVQASRQDIEQMKKEMEGISYEDLHFLFDMLLKGERDMAFCHDSQLVLELLLLRFCNAPRLENITPLHPDSAKKKKEALNKTSRLSPEKLSSPPVKSEMQEIFSSSSHFLSSEANKMTGEDFDGRFDFIEFLKEKDQTLTALVENLSLRKKSARHFCFVVPESFSYLKNKLAEPSFQKLLEEQLAEFLNSEEKIRVEILDSKIKELSLREEKRVREEDQLLKQIEADSFVNEVKNLFEGEIRSVKKTPG